MRAIGDAINHWQGGHENLRQELRSQYARILRCSGQFHVVRPGRGRCRLRALGVGVSDQSVEEREASDIGFRSDSLHGL